MKQKLSDLLNIGIEGLDIKNIKWLSQNIFTSPALDEAGQSTSGKIQVTIESFNQGLPSRLHYAKTIGNDRQEFLILCQYGQPIFPPSEVVIKKTINSKNVVFTNIIRRIIWGLREDSKQGFEPTNFYSMDTVSKDLYTESNGARYFILTNGMRQVVNIPAKNMDNTDTQLNSKQNVLRFIFLVSLVLPLIYLVYKTVGGKRKIKKLKTK